MNYFDQERILYYPFIINNSIFHTLNAAVLRTIVVRLLFMIPFFSTNVIFGELTVLSEREGLRKFYCQLHVFRPDYHNILA